MKRFTSLGRVLDLRYPSNRLAVVVTVLAAGIGAGLDSDPIRGAVVVGGSTFLAWALGRELDPDRSLSAAVAAVAAGLVAVALDPTGVSTSLGGVYLALAAVRVLVRATGRPPTLLDLTAHLAIAAWLSVSPVGWIPAAGLGVAFVQDTALTEPAPRVQLWWGSVTGIVALVGAGLSRAAMGWSAPPTSWWVLVALGVVGAIVVIRPERVISRCDYSDRPIDARRLRAGRMMAAALATGATVVAGWAGIAGLAPVWVALASAGAVRLASRG